MALHVVKCHQSISPCNSGMLNPAHIDLFRAVIRHGGITRAAEALGIGQPHVSRAIAQLEADLGFPLFIRGRGSAFPTKEGEAFSREVDRTYAGLDQLEHAARQIREIGMGSLRIACQPSLASRLVPRAIRRLVLDNSNARIALHVPTPDTIWSLVSTGQCDIGLVRPRAGYTDVASETFLTLDAVCALPRRHPLARKRAISISDLADVPLIAGAPGAFQHDIEASFASAGITPRFVLMAQYTAARCGLVAEGLGAAIVDPISAGELTGLPIVLRRLRPRLPIETLLIQPGGMRRDRLAARFIEFLKAERDDVIASLG